MKAVPLSEMIEPTRLTREGRLEQAKAVIQRALASLPFPVAPREVKGEAKQKQREEAPQVLDLMPPSPRTGSSWTSPHFTPASIYPVRDAHPMVSGAPRGWVEGMEHTGSESGRTSAEPVAASAPQGARFVECTYASQAGMRRYKLYVPSGYKGQSVPLLVLLHGCTQSPDDFAAGTRMNDLAEEQTFLVAYPEQAPSANASKCWNWFRTGDQQRDQGEPCIIAGITRQIMREYSVEAGRVYVAVLSAGGAAAAIMGSNYPDLYAAIGVHSGLACGAARNISSAYAAMRQGAPAEAKRTYRHDQPAGVTPTIVFHGDRDTTVSPINGDQIIAQSKASAILQTAVSHGVAPGGIRFTRTVYADKSGRLMLEQWVLHGGGHAWSGGSSAGSYTDPRGPDASREMVRFFLELSGRPAAGQFMSHPAARNTFFGG